MFNFQWRVIVEIKQGFNPVSILWYATSSYEDAFNYLETRQHLITKKRKIFVKKLGKRTRYYDRADYEHDEPEPTADLLPDHISNL